MGWDGPARRRAPAARPGGRGPCPARAGLAEEDRAPARAGVAAAASLSSRAAGAGAGAAAAYNSLHAPRRRGRCRRAPFPLQRRSPPTAGSARAAGAASGASLPNVRWWLGWQRSAPSSEIARPSRKGRRSSRPSARPAAAARPALGAPLRVSPLRFSLSSPPLSFPPHPSPPFPLASFPTRSLSHPFARPAAPAAPGSPRGRAAHTHRGPGRQEEGG